MASFIQRAHHLASSDHWTFSSWRRPPMVVETLKWVEIISCVIRNCTWMIYFQLDEHFHEVNILFMAPRMVYCSIIYLLWSVICRSEYDVSVRQLRTLWHWRTQKYWPMNPTGTREKWRRPYTSNREPLPWTEIRDTICLPSTTKLSRQNLRQHTWHQYVNKVRSWWIETNRTCFDKWRSKVSKLYYNNNIVTLRTQAPRKMSKTRYTSHLNNYSLYIGQICRVLCLYTKKVTHQVICNLHINDKQNIF